MTEKKQPAPPPEDKAEVEAPAQELHPADALEAAINELLDGYSLAHLRGQYDQRLIAIARTQIELGFLALHKALGQAEAGEA